MYLIYKHTNLENGLVYIGYTGQSLPEDRWKGGRGYKKSHRFYSAILEYGWLHFSHEIIESNILTKEEALARETFWIQYYNAADPKYGYNIINKQPKQNKIKRKTFTFQSEETKMRQREGARKGGKAQAQKVQCIETNRIFSSQTEAAHWCGLSNSSQISLFLNGKAKSAGRHPETNVKLHWRRVE